MPDRTKTPPDQF